MLIFASLHPHVLYSYLVSSNEQVTPKKAAYSLDWGAGKV